MIPRSATALPRDIARDDAGNPVSSGAERLETSPRRLRLLIFAYACEPGRGSEPGAGWGLVRALGSFADCTVLVGPEHVPAIRRWEAEHDESCLEFVEVGERWFTPPNRRHRLTRFGLYITWLRRAHQVGTRLHRRSRFDAVSHATYSTYWLPTPAVLYDVPCVWGPIGGAVVTPLGLWPALGWRGVLSEVLDYVAVRTLSAWPGTRRTWLRATAPIVQNQATLKRLPRTVRNRALVLNHAMFTEVPEVQALARGRYCLVVGALEARKGVRLALRALASAHPEVELRVIGGGPERTMLELLARRLGVQSRVRFYGSASRDDVLRSMRQAVAVIFTGLREEGGIALAEAMLIGAPVIVLAHGGAGHIAASATDPSRVILVPPTTVEGTARRVGEAMTRFYQNPPERWDATLDTADARRRLRAAVEEVCDVATGRGR